MKVVDKIEIKGISECKITFIRINPEDKKDTIKKILEQISNLSWIDKLMPDELKNSMKARVDPTVDFLDKQLSNNNEDEITSKTGEYFVSEIARETIINELEYSDIPLAELRKEKVSGNPGFDYHSENKNNIIIFGEAKYVAGQNAYGRALKQVVEFIDAKKDLKELTELTSFVSNEAIKNANLERKGYAIGFSSYSNSSEDLISNIRKSKHFKKIIRYEEIVIVAVDING